MVPRTLRTVNRAARNAIIEAMPVCRLTRHISFPPVDFAVDGLLAVGGDLSRERLLLAYRSGIFPWYSAGEPLLWWSPDPRMILVPGEFHYSRSLRRTVKRGEFTVTLDQAFPAVIRACGDTPRPGQDGTWITREMKKAYIDLHECGHAHSFECWRGDALVGGLYGVAIGGLFFGESMFSHRDDASKIAALAMVTAASAWGIPFIDCQVANPHLIRLGAREISRSDFCRRLAEGLNTTLSDDAWRVLPPLPDTPRVESGFRPSESSA